MGLFNFRGMLL